MAADQLVYAYPYSVGPAVDVSCGADEIVVLCPAWAVGGMLGPGRHQWQSPEPGKPLAVYFVLTLSLIHTPSPRDLSTSRMPSSA